MLNYVLWIFFEYGFDYNTARHPASAVIRLSGLVFLNPETQKTINKIPTRILLSPIRMFDLLMRMYYSVIFSYRKFRLNVLFCFFRGTETNMSHITVLHLKTYICAAADPNYSAFGHIVNDGFDSGCPVFKIVYIAISFIFSPKLSEREWSLGFKEVQSKEFQNYSKKFQFKFNNLNLS